jgi:hypothetical protein
MDGSSDVVRFGQMEHLYSGAESREGAHNHEGRKVMVPKNGFVTRVAK